MPSDATQILNAVAAGIKVVDAQTDVLIRMQPPDPEPTPVCGWMPGDRIPSWIVTMAREDRVDRYATFSHRSIDYVVTISYVRGFIPGCLEDDPAVRDLKAAIRNQLGQVKLAGASSVYGAPEWKEGTPYRQRAGGDTLLLVSDQEGTFHVWEPRT